MSDIKKQLEDSLKLHGIDPAQVVKEAEARYDDDVRVSIVHDNPHLSRSLSIAKIGAALAKAQKTMRGAAKDASNPHFGSKYADLASIMDACRDALTANDIAVLQSPSAEGNLVRMKTMLLHSSGEWILSDPLQVQARDAGPQSVGSCLTYLRRYQLAGMIGVTPDDDGEAATDHGKKADPKKAESKGAAKPNGASAPNQEDLGITHPDGPITNDMIDTRPMESVYLRMVGPTNIPDALAELVTHTGETLPMFREPKHVTEARRACRERQPVKLTKGTGKNSGKPYVSGLVVLDSPL